MGVGKWENKQMQKEDEKHEMKQREGREQEEGPTRAADI